MTFGYLKLLGWRVFLTRTKFILLRCHDVSPFSFSHYSNRLKSLRNSWIIILDLLIYLSKVLPLIVLIRKHALLLDRIIIFFRRGMIFRCIKAFRLLDILIGTILILILMVLSCLDRMQFFLQLFYLFKKLSCFILIFGH